MSGGFGWVAPLIAMVAKGNVSPVVKAHAVDALNFQITWAIASIIAVCLGVCGSFLILPLFLLFVPLVPIIFGIIAGVKASNNEPYRYPMTIRFIK